MFLLQKVKRSLAELLKKDLDELGLVNLEISEYSVLTGKLPAIYQPEAVNSSGGWFCCSFRHCGC